MKDHPCNRIVGYSIVSRWKSRLAVTALDNAVVRRRVDSGDATGCVVRNDRGSQCPPGHVPTRVDNAMASSYDH